MNLTSFIDIAVGLSLLYLGASLFVTILNEAVSQFFQLRGRQLVTALAQVIDNPTTRGALAKVPTLTPLFVTGAKARKPTYVDPGVFANALVGTFDLATVGVAKMNDVVKAIEALNPSPMRSQLLALAHAASEDVDKFVISVGTWVDKSLQMLGERYKVWLRRISFGLGLTVAVAFNLDTVSLVSHLYRDAAAREALAVAGSQFVAKIDDATFQSCVQDGVKSDKPECKVVGELTMAVTSGDSQLGTLPIGWPCDSFNGRPWTEVVTRILGWFLTALALSLGAPFWFDLLSKVTNIRHGMSKPRTDEK